MIVELRRSLRFVEGWKALRDTFVHYGIDDSIVPRPSTSFDKVIEVLSHRPLQQFESALATALEDASQPATSILPKRIRERNGTR